MASFNIKAPDGSSYTVQGENAEGALAALQHYLSVKSAPDLGAGHSLAGGVIEGLPIVGPLLKGGVDRAVAFGRSVTGGPDYDTALAQQQAANEATDTKHSTAQTIGKVTGGVAGYTLAGMAAPELMGFDAGAPMASRVLAGAGSNGVIGGADTAVRDIASGKGFDPVDAAKGAGMGFGLGAVAAPFGQAMGAMAKPVGRLIGGMFAPAIPEGIGSPAAKVLADAIATDSAVKPVGQRLAELGPEGRLIDAGDTLKGWGMGVSAAPGANRANIINALMSRDAGATGRIGRDVDAALGPARNPYEVTSGFAGQRTAIHNDLPKVFAAAPPVDTSQVLTTIAKGLTKAVGPERAALLKMREWLIDQAQGGGISPVRDAERLNNAKMAIDTLIDYGDAGLGVPAGALKKTQGTLSTARKQLNDALRTQVPGYSDIMDRSSALARQMEAVETGNKVVTGGDPALKENFAADFAGMAPAEQAAARLGMRSGVNRILRSNANDRVGLRRAVGGEGDWNRENLSAAFGRNPTDQLLNSADREATFAATTHDIVHNSKTAPRLAAEKMATAAPTSGMSGAAVSAAAGGAPGVAAYGATRGAGKVISAVHAASLGARNNDIARALISPKAAAIADALIKRAGIVDKGGEIAARLGPVVQALIGYEASMRKGEEFKKALAGAYGAWRTLSPALSPF